MPSAAEARPGAGRGSGTLRAFVAIEIPPAVRAALAAAARGLAARIPELRTVPEANLHLTLRFLGDIPESEAVRAGQAIERALGTAPPVFALDLAGLGAFPDVRRPRVVFAAVAGGAREVEALAACVREALPAAAAGDEKPFRAHVTIARSRAGAAPGLAEAIAAHPLAPARFAVGGVALVESRLGGGPPLYVVRSRFALPAPVPLPAPEAASGSPIPAPEGASGHRS